MGIRRIRLRNITIIWNRTKSLNIISYILNFRLFSSITLAISVGVLEYACNKFSIPVSRHVPLPAIQRICHFDAWRSRATASNGWTCAVRRVVFHQEVYGTVGPFADTHPGKCRIRGNDVFCLLNREEVRTLTRGKGSGTARRPRCGVLAEPVYYFAVTLPHKFCAMFHQIFRPKRPVTNIVGGYDELSD